MKILIGLAFAAILAALGFAGVYMLRGGGQGDGQRRPGRMMRALAVRVGLSVTLFLCLLGAYAAGWIQPTGLPLGH